MSCPVATHRGARVRRNGVPSSLAFTKAVPPASDMVGTVTLHGSEVRQQAVKTRGARSGGQS